MDTQQAMQSESYLLELVDAQTSELCLTCGQRTEIVETSSGQTMICPRCDGIGVIEA